MCGRVRKSSEICIEMQIGVTPYTRIMAENDDLFLLAAERMRTNTGLTLNNEQKLTIYGYYKQVSLILSHNELSSCIIGN